MRVNVITSNSQRVSDPVFARVSAMRWPRRRSRLDKAVSVLRESARDLVTPRRTLAAVGVVTALGMLAYAGKRRGWRAIAFAADLVEEAADTVEDAAEDISAAAHKRAASSGESS
jgi:hypothetical protein